MLEAVKKEGGAYESGCSEEDYLHVANKDRKQDAVRISDIYFGNSKPA